MELQSVVYRATNNWHMWDNYKLLFGLANRMLWVVLALFLLAGVRFVLGSSFFPVRSIYIKGVLEKVTQEQLHYIAQNDLRGTFFTLNMDEMRQAFEKLPWVKQVHLRRRWPDTLDVEVTEHRAVARWGDNGLIDETGRWFDAATNEHLPLFSGPVGSEKTMASFLPQMMRVIGPLGLTVDKVEITRRGAWCVFLSNHIVLELGSCDVKLLSKRIERFARHWSDILQKNPAVRYVDLRYTDGFAINAP